ncbi:MAG: ribosome recycling factor [Rhodospirillaceae bacterium]|nr:ribosome recycling factor [Rhodospirillaceae bacterium]MCY4238063.1 ribosome recycling factor [Rhodospirillaceae bacterium]
MIDPILKDIKRRMDGAMAAFRNDLAGLRTGRANTSLLESISVEAYGAQMPMKQAGNISVPEARLLSVQVWDVNLVGAVEKAIRESDLGLNPQTEGQVIRVPLPELTEERRKELVKVAGNYAEQARVAVRNVRRDGMERLKKAEKAGDISQDEQRARSEDVQRTTNEHVKDIDDLLAQKQGEIMQV